MFRFLWTLPLSSSMLVLWSELVLTRLTCDKIEKLAPESIHLWLPVSPCIHAPPLLFQTHTHKHTLVTMPSVTAWWRQESPHHNQYHSLFLFTFYIPNTISPPPSSLPTPSPTYLSTYPHPLFRKTKVSHESQQKLAH